MTIDDVTVLVTALTAFVTAIGVAIGGVIAAIKVLREVRTGNELTQTGNILTNQVKRQLNTVNRTAVKNQEDIRAALERAGLPVNDESLEEEPNAIRQEKER